MAQGAIPEGRGFEPHSCQWHMLVSHGLQRLAWLPPPPSWLHGASAPQPKQALPASEAHREARPEIGHGLRAVKHGCLPRKEGFQDLWNRHASMTVWPSGLRRWLKAPFRKGVGSNPTAVNAACALPAAWPLRLATGQAASSPRSSAEAGSVFAGHEAKYQHRESRIREHTAQEHVDAEA